MFIACMLSEYSLTTIQKAYAEILSIGVRAVALLRLKISVN